MLCGVIAEALQNHYSPTRGATRLNGGSPYYNVYRTSDNKYFSIAAIEPWFWENLCRAIGREDLIPYQDAGEEKLEEIGRILEDVFSTKTRDEWFEALRDANISVGKVYDLEEALRDPQAIQRGMVVELEAPGISEGKVIQPGIPFHLSETPGKVRHPGSVTGQHTEEVLTDLGYTPIQIDGLLARGVVASG